ERNPILVTALNPVIGYEKGAAIAKQAYAEGRPIREVAAELTDLPREQLPRLLDPAELTSGGIKGGSSGGGSVGRRGSEPRLGADHPRATRRLHAPTRGVGMAGTRPV